MAEKHLSQGGVQSIRLSAIAREIGVTHQAILRHFGSREELIAALLRSAARKLRTELRAAVAVPRSTAESVEQIFERIAATYRSYAVLTVQLVLAGRPPRGSGLYRDVAETIHRRRVADRRNARTPAPSLDDTLFGFLLLTLALWADVLIGPAMRRALDLPADEKTAARFRRWLLRLLEDRVLA
ncbi:MAG TPA: helix-turn-helix domain-containing protein [Candidatus Dormibacteraeota bacterium]|nr:helix-turn-helix domain-containing protein [Candidatus Dormibacteraeota bacterium]